MRILAESEKFDVFARNITRRANHQYFVYSRVIFSVYSFVTSCTDQGEIWCGRADHIDNRNHENYCMNT